MSIIDKVEKFLGKKRHEQLKINQDGEVKEKNQVKKGPKSALKKGETHHRIRMQFDIGYRGAPGIKNEGDSMAIPDLTLTMRQLIENHTRGNDGKVRVKKPLYLELPIPVMRDFTDVDEYKLALQEQLEKVNEFIANDKKEAQEAKEQKEREQAELERKKEDLKGTERGTGSEDTVEN